MKYFTRNILFLSSLIFFSGNVFGMGEKLTIEPELSTVFLKSGKFKKIYEEGTDFLADNPNKAYRIALDLQTIAIRVDKAELTFLADYFLAKCYYFFNDSPKAIKVFEVANKMAVKKKWINAQIKVNIYLAATFANKRNYLLADKYYQRALALATANKRNDFILELYERIGLMQISMNQVDEYSKAKKYFLRGLQLAIQQKDTSRIGIFYTRLGLLGNKGEANDSSISLIKKGIAYHMLAPTNENLLVAYKSLGDAYYSMEKNDSSLFYYLEVYKIHKKTGQARVSAVSACDVAYMYGSTGNIDLLNKYADTALMYSRRDKSGESRFYVTRWLADIYKNLGKFEIANKYYKYQAYILDSTLKSGNGEALTSAGMQSDFDGQLEVIQLKQEKEREILQKEKENQAFVTRLYLIGLVIVLIFLIIIFREFRINRKQKIIISQQHENVSSQKIVLEVKNKEITDSINYALRIQSALLPNPDELIKLLNGSFIYYAPKDIVSGDFYWFYKRNEFIYIACGDCTGHGVPGALMSVLGINLLSDIIDGNKASEPAKILDLLRAGIIRSLNKDNESGLYKDGMDLSLIKIDTKKLSCVFAGANNPVYHISNGNLIEYKASSQPVGYSHKLDPFTQTEFNLTKNDFIILFTDGFADQFGGQSNKKFMYKKFKDVLITAIANNEKSIDSILKNHFVNWKGNFEQVDDVCVIGIRI